jgi:prolyl 4-hydroxylase
MDDSHPNSLQGECEVNPRYMKMNCGPVCESCEYLSIEGRCKMEDAGPEVWKPGDLDRMFQRISGQPFRSTYSVQILSSPETNDGAPWVVTLENVLSADEAEKLIELGTVEGYTRSLDVGEVTAAGAIKSIESSTRTSTNAWCQSDDCYKHEIVQTVTSRISDMVQIPEENSEYFQILRYEPGQL